MSAASVGLLFDQTRRFVSKRHIAANHVQGAVSPNTKVETIVAITGPLILPNVAQNPVFGTNLWF